MNFGLLNTVLLHDFFNVCIDMYHFVLYMKLAVCNNKNYKKTKKTSVMGLDDEKGRQELRPRGPSSMPPLSSVIKDAFDKFEHDFQAANLPEGKYIKPPPSTAKWYKVGQPSYEEKIQDLNTDYPQTPWGSYGQGSPTNP